MTREEIIALAKQHGASAYTNRHYPDETYMTFSPEKLEAFFYAAQQTTEPLGFQIRRAIAAEDELRATKQTLEHAYAALQKVADAQAAIEEPELPEAVDIWLAEHCDTKAVSETTQGAEPVNGWSAAFRVYTAAQMHDHFAAGVRAGMGQSQDAKRYRFIRDNIYRLPYDDHGAGPEFDLSEEAIDSAMQGGQK